MTREEAYNRIDAIIAKHEIDDEYVTVTNEKDYDALRLCRKVIEQEPCEDAISRQAVNEIINGIRDCISVEGYWAFLERLKKLPPVNPLSKDYNTIYYTPQPKTGHWIFDEILDKHYYCSECKSMGVDYWDYCPYCGARMVEPQESEG